MEPTGYARGARHLLEYAVARGADAAELVRRMDLRGAALHDPDGRVPTRSYYALIEAAGELLADPYFGLSYIDGVTPDAIGAVGFLAMTSSTLGESIGRILRYYRVLADGERLTLEPRGDTVAVRYEPFGPPRPAHAQCAEMYAFDFLVMAARMTGAPVPIVAFDVRHARRCGDAPYRRLFGREPSFGAAENCFAFPADVLERPMPRADAALSSFFLGYVERLGLALPPANLIESVRRALGGRLVDGPTPLADLARALGLGARSLQRQLAQAGTSVSAELDGVRRERAQALLDASLPIGEVSYLLGFSEPRAFHRAFRRWTGFTPAQFRSRPSAPRVAGE